MSGVIHRVISDPEVLDDNNSREEEKETPVQFHHQEPFHQYQQEQEHQEKGDIGSSGVGGGNGDKEKLRRTITTRVGVELSSLPAVIELEDSPGCPIEAEDINNSSDCVPLGNILKGSSPTFTANSSLSDNSAAGRLQVEEKQQTQILQDQVDQDIDMEDVDEMANLGSNNHNRLTPSGPVVAASGAAGSSNSRVGTVMERSDSKVSEESSSGSGSGSGSGSMRASNYSQNSSRDWGWFEDVHYGSDQNLSKHSQQQSPSMMDAISMALTNHKGRKKSKRPFVPQAVVTSSSDQNQAIIPPRDESAAAMAVTAPTYVLEESLSSQKLWKDTAGNRPPQPVEERAFYEKMWAQNFARSKVNYCMPVEVLTATSPISLSPFADGLLETGNNLSLDNYDVYSQPPSLDNEGAPGPASGSGASASDAVPGGDNTGVPSAPEGMMFWNYHHNKNKSTDDSGSWEPYRHQHIVNKTVKDTNDGEYLTVMVRGDNVFGTTVSKSFARANSGSVVGGIDTVNISIASYRVVESKKHGKYAQFLVIYREGSIRDTIGVWKRYSDFCELSRKVTQAHEGCASVIANMSPLAMSGEHDIEHLPNAITSWRLLKKRQRWYRCLDAGYLSLKVFLLERFLHDILFESSSPKLLREFVGATDSNSVCSG